MTLPHYRKIDSSVTLENKKYAYEFYICGENKKICKRKQFCRDLGFSNIRKRQL